MQVVIMRGLPGSGKSTWVRHQLAKPEFKGWLSISADDWFGRDDQYKFDPKKLGEAHGYCLRCFTDVLSPHGISEAAGVFVDNTNTTVVEIAPYYALALAYGADVKIVRINCPFEIAAPRNVHGVPASTIWRMHQNILSERLPPHWNEEIIWTELTASKEHEELVQRAALHAAIW